jgi:lipoyl(octanoyl) transferase
MSAAPTCRLLPYWVADGPHNMAADEVLLQSAQQGLASLRFYGWSAATVSLGYFQPASVRQADPLLASLPYVRRPTGGATLVHHHEVTYALALPPGKPWQTNQSWLRRMHALIGSALVAWQLAARLQPPGEEAPFTGVLCFQHHTAGDLLIGGAKIGGSAQRKQRGALLQHGAILLAASPYTPQLPGIQQLTEKTLQPREVCQAVGREFSKETGWTLVPSAATRQELDQIQNLTDVKYSQAAWNERR